MTASALVLGFVSDWWFAILPLLVALYLVWNRYQRGLNKIPGPWLRSISVLPRVVSVYRGMSHEDDMKLHERYGSVVRVAPNSLSVSDPAAINAIYGIGTKFTKSPFYRLSEAYDEEGLIPDPFILTDKELHTRMKRNAANAYSMNGLVQMEPWIEPVTDRLLQQLRDYADKGAVADLGLILSNYTMDAVFALTFGRDFDYLNRGDVLRIMHIVKLASFYMAVFGQFAWSHRFLLENPVVAGWVFRGTNSDGSDSMVEVAITQVERARELSDEGKALTFVQRLVLNQRNNPELISDRDVLTHAFGNITAGSDTTATALRSILYHVLRDPAVYSALCREVRGAGLALPVSYAAANALPYLAAVIKEGMRIHPSVGMMLARIVPPEGAVVAGHTLQAGVEVGVNPWVVQWDPHVFPDPNRFWPDRWLPSVSSDTQLRDMNRSFLTFGHGAHTCSGRWISTMEMTKLIPTLLLNFDLELADVDSYRFKNFWFMLQEGLTVKLTRLI